MTTAAHNHSPARALMPDMVRAVSLFGIAVVNVMGFSWAFETGFFDGAIRSPVDKWANGILWSFFAMKFYALFSMMFGAGLAYQAHSAARAGQDFSARYFRRMAGLLAIGVVHFIFFWMGDILMAYALFGTLFFAMKDFKTRTYVRLGFILILLNAMLLLLFAGILLLVEKTGIDINALLSDPTSNPLSLEAEKLGGDNATFLSAAVFRASVLLSVAPSLMLQQGLGILGFFCFGLAAVRNNAIDNPQHPVWRRARWQFLPLGFVFSLIGAWFISESSSAISSVTIFGTAILMAASPLLTVGYAGLIAKASMGTPGRIRRFIARAGSASLSAYLLQSLLLSFIFCGYGLGLHSQLSAAQAITIGALVGMISLILTGTWRSFANRGPMEVLLRKVTYLGE